MKILLQRIKRSLGIGRSPYDYLGEDAEQHEVRDEAARDAQKFLSYAQSIGVDGLFVILDNVEGRIYRGDLSSQPPIDGQCPDEDALMTVDRRTGEKVMAWLKAQSDRVVFEHQNGPLTRYVVDAGCRGLSFNTRKTA